MSEYVRQLPNYREAELLTKRFYKKEIMKPLFSIVILICHNVLVIYKKNGQVNLISITINPMKISSFLLFHMNNLDSRD